MVQTYKKKIKELAGIPSKLIKLRERMNFSTMEIASVLGIKRRAYNRYENGERVPNLMALYALSKHYNISMDWLLLDKGGMECIDKETMERYVAADKQLAEVSAAKLESERELAEMKQKEVLWQQERLELSRKQAVLQNDVPQAEFRELFDRMKQDPLLYHDLMNRFQEYKQKEKQTE